MTVYERKPRENKPTPKKVVPAIVIEKLPKRISKPTKIKLTDVKSAPIRNITNADLKRKNHEAFHFEKDDYKITVRYEYIEDVGKVHRILGNRADSNKYAQDKVGLVYRSCVYYEKISSLKNSKGYKFQPISAEYAKAYGIYQPPEFMSVTQAVKQINDYHKGINPYRRMTMKYK